MNEEFAGALILDTEISTDAHEVTVFRYGLRAPTDWARDCDDEIYKMNKFWNTLVEIEHTVRAEYRAISEQDTSVATAQAQVEELKNALEKTTQGTPEQRAAKKAYSQGCEKAKLARRAVRNNSAIKAKLDALEVTRKERVKLARQNSDVAWSNYNGVINSYNVARSRAM